MILQGEEFRHSFDSQSLSVPLDVLAHCILQLKLFASFNEFVYWTFPLVLFY